MAVDLNQSGDDEGAGPIAAINVTPFVDVVLVLLVIFMVTAPLIMKDVIGIRLPRAAAGDGRKVTTLGVAINRNGTVLLNGTIVGRQEVAAEVKRAMAGNPEVQAVISADRETRHGDVVRAIDWIRSAGLSRFAVQIERETNAP
jgi:biopolymer transport protein ExbD